MYKIIGGDGKTYGPSSLDQLKQWIAEGRVNPQTAVQEEGAVEWKTAAQIPELAALLSVGAPRPGGAPPPLFPPGPAVQQTGLAIASLVLGLLSIVCFGILAGIPAIICGHIARARAQRLPAQYGGAGQALAGLILGYVSIFITLFILPAMLLPALARAKERAQRINCMNNMKQIGVAFKIWQLDHGDQLPFNVSTNKGGTLEFCAMGADGFDHNSALHLMVLSNELVIPRILVCPGDSKRPALDFQTLTAANVTYQLHSGTNVADTNPQAVLAVCPIHNNVLLCDGSIQYTKRPRISIPARSN
ncbi:MAG TPA: DUF4190 domain-containing protein [Candidatus Binatia bacterium]|jgi:hypothetical protein|nr:DUF4190 domain-containing protein [Candidatus Binatia bacterium]